MKICNLDNFVHSQFNKCFCYKNRHGCFLDTRVIQGCARFHEFFTFLPGVWSIVPILAVLYRVGADTSIALLWETQSRHAWICTKFSKSSTPLNAMKLEVLAARKVNFESSYQLKLSMTTEQKLHKIWRSRWFCKNSGKRAYPCYSHVNGSCKVYLYRLHA